MEIGESQLSFKAFKLFKTHRRYTLMKKHMPTEILLTRAVPRPHKIDASAYMYSLTGKFKQACTDAVASFFSPIRKRRRASARGPYKMTC